MFNSETNKPHVFHARVASPVKLMPAIVWRSNLKPKPPGARQTRRLHLVTKAPENSFERRRRERIAVRTRFVEGAYLAAALGTALVIWWSAR